MCVYVYVCVCVGWARVCLEIGCEANANEYKHTATQVSITGERETPAGHAVSAADDQELKRHSSYSISEYDRFPIRLSQASLQIYFMDGRKAGLGGAGWWRRRWKRWKEKQWR